MSFGVCKQQNTLVLDWLTRLAIRLNMGPLLRLRVKSFAIKLWGDQHSESGRNSDYCRHPAWI